MWNQWTQSAFRRHTGGMCLYQILVVEDEPLVRMATVDVFVDTGLSVIEAATADEAWLILQRRPDITLVVTDVDMPGTLNGAALAHRIRLEYPHLAVAVVSGVLPKPELPPGVSFFVKPVADETLRDLVFSIDSSGLSARRDSRNAPPHS